MNVLATAEAWVAANQMVVMATFIATFVAFHLILLTQAVKEEGTNNNIEETDEEFWAAVHATPWMM